MRRHVAVDGGRAAMTKRTTTLTMRATAKQQATTIDNPTTHDTCGEHFLPLIPIVSTHIEAYSMFVCMFVCMYRLSPLPDGIEPSEPSIGPDLLVDLNVLELQRVQAPEDVHGQQRHQAIGRPQEHIVQEQERSFEGADDRAIQLRLLGERLSSVSTRSRWRKLARAHVNVRRSRASAVRSRSGCRWQAPRCWSNDSRCSSYSSAPSWVR